MAGRKFSIAVAIFLVCRGLWAEATPAGDERPRVEAVSPLPGSILNGTAVSIDVQFSKPVTGVDATDLVLEGSAAANASVGPVSEVAADTWRFPVTGLQSGALIVSLSPTPGGITDGAGQALEPSPTTWAYGVTLPPTHRVLYLGTYSTGVRSLYSFNLDTGAWSRVTTPFEPYAWLESAPDGTLYALSGTTLYIVDPTTGVTTPAAELRCNGVPIACYGFTFSPAGIMYLREYSDRTGTLSEWLYTGDPVSGELEPIGPITGNAALLLSIEYGDDTLYGSDGISLYKIDAQTAVATVISTACRTADMDYGPDHVMRGVFPQDRRILTIDLEAGVSSLLASVDPAPWGIAYGTEPDITPPVVVGVWSDLPPGVYGEGTQIPVNVTFSEPVRFLPTTGTACLALRMGTAVRMAEYVGGDTTSTLTFVYTTARGDNDPHLDYTGIDALTLSGNASIRDGARNDALLLLPMPGSTNSLSGTTAIAVDAEAPKVTVDPLVTEELTPTLTGTFTGATRVEVTVDGRTYAATLGLETWTARVSHPLEPGTYEVVAVAMDDADNSGTDNSTNELTVRAGLWVDFAYTGVETGSRAQPFNTLGEAVAASAQPGLIRINGSSAVRRSPEVLRITKAVRVRAVGGAVRIGDRVPSSGAGVSSSGQVAKGAARNTAVSSDADRAWLAFLLLRLKEGVRGLSTTADSPLYAPVLPSGAASPEDALCLRVRADEDIDRGSLRIRMPARLLGHCTARTRLASPGDATDLWVIVTPSESWPVGMTIPLAVEARTASGAAVPQVRHIFRVTATEEDGHIPDPPAGGMVYRFEPETVYDAPREFTIEEDALPDGTVLYYYMPRGSRQGWHPAELVEDFLAPCEPGIAHEGPAEAWTFRARHGRYVAVGASP